MTTPRKTTRRQFLSGESAVEAIGDLTHGTGVDEATSSGRPRTPRPEATYLVQLSRTAMACEFQIFLTAEHPPHAPEVAMEALDLIDRLEDQLTIYRPHSEVSRLNALAAEQPMPVEPKLFELLRECATLFHETQGAFDITSGPLSEVWGFSRRQGRLPSDEELAQALMLVDGRHLQLDEHNRTVRFAQEGVRINLGGIGKGYALDQAARRLRMGGVDNFIFHGGRSSVIAAGHRVPERPRQNPWTVGIGHPMRPERRLGLMRLHDRAMGTSGTATQSFHHQGKRYGHILDPRTGRPAEGVLSVTVLADDAATADALSTALYVLGPEKATEFCRRHPDVSALISLPCGSATRVETLALNLEDDQWQPAGENSNDDAPPASREQRRDAE